MANSSSSGTPLLATATYFSKKPPVRLTGSSSHSFCPTTFSRAMPSIRSARGLRSVNSKSKISPPSPRTLFRMNSASRLASAAARKRSSAVRSAARVRWVAMPKAKSSAAPPSSSTTSSSKAPVSAAQMHSAPMTAPSSRSGKDSEEAMP